MGSQALQGHPSQRLRFFDALWLLAYTSDADAQEGVAPEHIQCAQDRITDPVRFFAKPSDGSWLAQLFFALGLGMIPSFAGAGFFFFPFFLDGRMELISPERAGREFGAVSRISSGQSQAN